MIGRTGDGRSVYRRFIKGLGIPSGDGTSSELKYTQYGKKTLEIDEILSIGGTLRLSGYEYDYSFPIASGASGSLFCILPVMTQNYLSINRVGATLSDAIISGTINMYLEYTKTTDAVKKLTVTLPEFVLASASSAKELTENVLNSEYS